MQKAAVAILGRGAPPSREARAPIESLYDTWYGTCVWHDIEAILSVASENASMDDLWMS